MRGYTCPICHDEIEPGSRNYFDASGTPCHLVCPKDDPDGEQLREALRVRRRALDHILGRTS